jgi:DNA modification methylase
MTQYSPSNPHPLSTMRTELVWDGKYDEFGNRRDVDVNGLSLPLQRIETIDEPRSRAEAQGKLFDERRAHPDDFRNRLIWGDNKLVTASLLQEFKGAIDLIYIDPPFDVGTDFSLSVPIGEAKETIDKDQSILEMVAYRDTWGKGTNSYLHMLYERLLICRELLSERGTIYVHIGPNINHLVRALLNEVFGSERLLNEIVWKRTHAHSDAKRFGVIHDMILMYANGDEYFFQTQYKPHDETYLKSHYGQTDDDGRKFRLVTLSAAGAGPARRFGDRLIEPPPGRHWAWGQERINEGLRSGRIVFARTGQPNIKQYLDDTKGTVIQSIWDDVPPVNPVSKELLGYATQKPEALLERIINASCPEGGLVADFFCGSGTTLAVAEKMGRRWIGADLGRFAVHISRKRLIELQRELHEAGRPYRSFDVYNLGRYERQWWQKEALQGADDEHRRIVLQFFRAEGLSQTPSPLLHGRKGTSFVHVDGIDSIFSRGEVVAVAEAVKAAGGREVQCLAWDFEMDLRQVVAAVEAEHGIKVRLHRIPREIMERNRTEVPPFFEVALLHASPVHRKDSKGQAAVDIKLENFLPSLTEVPSKELEALQERAVESGFDFIDFWAVDFDWKAGQPFNHHWQDYRTRRDRSLKTVSDAEFVYATKGTHTACVKVVDVFGCDTSITVEVKT